MREVRFKGSEDKVGGEGLLSNSNPLFILYSDYILFITSIFIFNYRHTNLMVFSLTI